MMYQLNMRELTYALSQALDYVGIDDTMHGKRVAYIACEIGKKLGWRQSKLDKLMLMAMLHDCGVSSNEVHDSLIKNLDWEDAQLHCEQGAVMLKNIPMYIDFSDVIAFHHTHWEQFLSHIDDEIKLYANLIYLSDRIDALYTQYGAYHSQEKEHIRSIIRQNTPSTFSPKLSQAFEELSYRDSFWYYLEPEYTHHYFRDWIEHGEIETVHFDLLKNIACMFANIIDTKNNKVSHHALEVATLAHSIAKLCDLPVREQEEIELAALLQDLGKLRIPDAIIHKTMPLMEDEKNKIKRQRFDTQIILQQIKGFESIAKIVSSYHKKLNAQESFYSSEEHLSLEATIVSIATEFQTLFNAREPQNLTLEKVQRYIEEVHKNYHIKGLTLYKITSYLKNYCKKALKP